MWTNCCFNPPFSSAGYYKTKGFGFEAYDFITLSLEPIPLGSVGNETLTWQLAFPALLTCMKTEALPCPARVDRQCWQLVERRDLCPSGVMSLWDLPFFICDLRSPLLAAPAHLRNALNLRVPRWKQWFEHCKTQRANH